MVKKIFLFCAKFLLLAIAIPILYLLSAFCLSLIATQKEENTSADIDIFILSNGVHTDIVVPTISTAIDWSQYIKYEHISSPPTAHYPYLAIGWGDKGFYLETPTWAELQPSVAFKATFGLSSSAMHTTYYTTMEESETCKKISLSHQQYHQLIQYIQQSFITNNEGQFLPIITTANYTDTDAFYEANGQYNLFRTCNTWANNGLKSCGQKAALWTPFTNGIFRHYE